MHHEQTPDARCFQGEGLTGGSTVDDYSVTIGSGDCTDMKLFTSLVSCYPPRSEPPKVTSHEGGHRVNVRLASFQNPARLL